MIKNKLQNLFDDIGFAKYHKIVSNPKNFSIFEVLGHADYEIRHSNTLAWLLQPNASHGINEVFIKKFIQLLDRNAAKGGIEFFSSRLIFNDLNIKREKDNVDITIFFKTEKFLIAIENKTGARSTEDDKQVEGYEKKLNKKYKDHTVKSVLLTASKEGDDSQYCKFIHVSWSEIYEIIKEIYKNKNFRFPEVRFFIRQYLEIIERKIIQKIDPQFGKDYMQKLLVDHRPVLEELRKEYKSKDTEDVASQVAMPYIFQNTFERLLNIYQEIPNELRSRVREFLRKKKFGTGISSSGEAGRLYFWGGMMQSMIVKLDMGTYLVWSITFAHNELSAQFYFYPPSKKKRVIRNNIKRVIEENPIEGLQLSEYKKPWKRSDYPPDYITIYETHFYDRTELSTLQPLEIQENIFQKVENLLDSDYRIIEQYFNDHLEEMKVITF